MIKINILYYIKLSIQIVEAKSLFGQTWLLDIDSWFPYRGVETQPLFKKLQFCRGGSMFCWTLPLSCQYRFRCVYIGNVWSRSYENNTYETTPRLQYIGSAWVKHVKFMKFGGIIV